jgi:hypothetical protein
MQVLFCVKQVHIPHPLHGELNVMLRVHLWATPIANFWVLFFLIALSRGGINAFTFEGR